MSCQVETFPLPLARILAMLPGMLVQPWFPTLIYASPLLTRPDGTLNRELLRESRQLRGHDDAGRRWSLKNYPGGFTSYATLCKLHKLSSTFRELEQRLNRHVRAFARQLDFDVRDARLEMTDCWVNIMPRQTSHSLHLHPLSTISGTYYVKTPKGCPALKFEDPRLDRFMAAPPRTASCRPENRTFVHYPAQAGHLIMFESWLRHEVPANAVAGERVSISFNYNWF